MPPPLPVPQDVDGHANGFYFMTVDVAGQSGSTKSSSGLLGSMSSVLNSPAQVGGVVGGG